MTTTVQLANPWDFLLPRGYLRKRRAARPFPELWRDYLLDHIPFVARLTPEQRHCLEGLVVNFIAEKRFEGCAGVVVTDEMKLAIAAEACRLILGHPRPSYFPTVSSVLLYPTTFVQRSIERSEAGTRRERREAVLGVAWERDLIILAWDDCVKGIENPRDGSNVVLHEFAHHLDLLSGSFDGVPRLSSQEEYATWIAVFQREFDEHQNQVTRGRSVFLNEYAATNVAEFFAVATEQFFEQPQRFLNDHPELYRTLQGYYRQDPLDHV